MKRYLFGRYVEGDLREIRDYISQDSPESARRVMLRFLEAFRLLASRPALGYLREDLGVPDASILAGGILPGDLSSRRAAAH